MRLTTLKRLKRSDENELERKLRLKKVNKHLRLAMERQDRKARLEKMVATKWLKLAMETRKKKSKTGEDGSYYTAHRLALETEEEGRAKNGMDLIWI